MNTFIALLRAVNVGGTGKLPMQDLRAICEAAGFLKVRTYIASGNVVFQTSASESKVKAALEEALANYAEKPIGVLVRTAAEMEQILARNPFPDAAPNRTVAIFLDEPPPAETLSGVTGRADEKIALGRREIYVHYSKGIGTSKLKMKATNSGTARNMNTVAKLVELARTL